MFPSLPNHPLLSPYSPLRACLTHHIVHFPCKPGSRSTPPNVPRHGLGHGVPFRPSPTRFQALHADERDSDSPAQQGCKGSHPLRRSSLSLPAVLLSTTPQDLFTANPHPPRTPPLAKQHRFVESPVSSVHSISTAPCHLVTPFHVHHPEPPSSQIRWAIIALPQLWRRVKWLCCPRCSVSAVPCHARLAS